MHHSTLLSALNDNVIPGYTATLNKLIYNSYEGAIWRDQLVKTDELLNLYSVKDMQVVRYKETGFLTFESNEDLLMEARIFLAPIEKSIIRQTYNVFNLMSELGGFIKLIHIIFGQMILPFNKYLFLLTMIKRMYFAKTEQSDLFQKPDQEFR